MQSKIRNFCIIAHIDHGKSTIADRILQITGAVPDREMKEQILDSLDLERERGITIKSQAVTLNYKYKDGELYHLNLIDTPGHVDFHYEVSRSLEACEGALLIIDAAQGVQAQTMANAILAMSAGLTIIPVINKIDLPNADISGVKEQCEAMLTIPADNAICVSGKTGAGIHELLDAIIEQIPPPPGNSEKPLRALIFDSWFDNYQGVTVLLKVVEGKISFGDQIQCMNTGSIHEVTRLGIFTPKPLDVPTIETGNVCFVAAAIKDLKDAKVGDTVTHLNNKAHKPLPGFKVVKPMVFAGFYPIDSAKYGELRDALEKLQLNDASLTFDPENSMALGFGFRCGFLGSLHMEIIQERLEREFGVDLITTAPNVVYHVLNTTGALIEVHSPADLPPTEEIEEIREPYALVTIHLPQEHLGKILTLCQERRGEQKKMEFFAMNKVMLEYYLPLAEMIFDFHSQLKSLSKGYASLDYEIKSYKKADLVKLNVLLNGDPVDALSMIVPKDNAYYLGKDLVEKIRKVVPRQMYDVAIQAAVGNRIISRETVKALRKDVTAKCYGGDISRKRKLLEKQKEGKKRMKRVGKVDIPQEAFLSLLKVK
ncbi:MAG: translation elongation factor 4 [Pseudomonadota bacterium]